MLIVLGADVALKNEKLKDAKECKDALTLSLAREKLAPGIDQLVEFQEEYFETKMYAVTYDGLMGEVFNSCMWNADILKKAMEGSGTSSQAGSLRSKRCQPMSRTLETL